MCLHLSHSHSQLHLHLLIFIWYKNHKGLNLFDTRIHYNLNLFGTKIYIYKKDVSLMQKIFACSAYYRNDGGATVPINF